MKFILDVRYFIYFYRSGGSNTSIEHQEPIQKISIHTSCVKTLTAVMATTHQTFLCPIYLMFYSLKCGCTNTLFLFSSSNRIN